MFKTPRFLCSMVGPNRPLNAFSCSGARQILPMKNYIYLHPSNTYYLYYQPTVDQNTYGLILKPYKMIHLAISSKGSFLFLRGHSCGCWPGA